jgi:hypothetical protein
MKKLVLLIGLGFFFNLGQAQDNSWGWGNQQIEQRKPVIAVPVIAISNQQEFDSIRLAVHMGSFKYKVYHYDSAQEIEQVEHFGEFPRIPVVDYMDVTRYVLVGESGQKLKMIHIDSDM